jgi:hypothetical protein
LEVIRPGKKFNKILKFNFLPQKILLGTFLRFASPINKGRLILGETIKTETQRYTMKKLLKSSILPIALVVGAAASTLSASAQSATATISDVLVGGNYDYTITLDNTGAYALNSFWYGWTQSGNNLPSDPNTLGNSLGWANIPDGNSIMWQNGGSGTALAPGHTATFTFIDSSTPIAITTSPSGESVAYVGSIDFSQGSPGDSTGVFSPVLVVPEPSTWALLAVGMVAAAGSVRFLAAARGR